MNYPTFTEVRISCLISVQHTLSTTEAAALRSGIGGLDALRERWEVAVSTPFVQRHASVAHIQSMRSRMREEIAQASAHASAVFVESHPPEEAISHLTWAIETAMAEVWGSLRWLLLQLERPHRLGLEALRQGLRDRAVSAVRGHYGSLGAVEYRNDPEGFTALIESTRWTPGLKALLEETARSLETLR